MHPSNLQDRKARAGAKAAGTKDPTHYAFTKATLQDSIAVAWKVSYFQISSKSPADKDSYDVVANVPEGATREQFQQMMKELLAERLQLKSHMESKDSQAYELVIAKGGLKLKESGAALDAKPNPDDDRFPTLASASGWTAHYSSSGRYPNPICRTRARQQTVGTIAQMAHTPGREPIVDKTGLTGLYDFTFEYALDTPAAHSDDAGPPPLPDVFAPLQEQLGLQLVAKKLPFDVVVVESFNRIPADN